MIDATTRSRRVELDDGVVVELDVAIDDERLTVCASDEHGNRVGIASCVLGLSPRPHEAEIEVTPTHRRRGIGGRLLRLLLEAAAGQGISMLTWTTPADDDAVRRLTEASGAICARRVAHGRAMSTIFVPSA